MKRLRLLVAGLFAASFYSAPVLACSCTTGLAESVFNRADAIFVGQMQGGTEQLSIPLRDGSFYEVEAGSVRFSVEEAFKGVPAGEVTIEVVSARGSSCGPYGLQRGVRYLIYADADEREQESKKLYTGYCSRSKPLDTEAAEQDLQALRNLPPAGSGGTLIGTVWENLQWRGRDRFADIKVRLQGPEAPSIEVVTDQQGSFRVNGLKPGKYRVQPQLPPGYITEYNKTYEVRIDDRGTAGVSIELNLDGRVSGRIVDSEGRDYNGASLRLEVDAPAGAQQWWNRTLFGHSTGAQGAFGFVGVPDGRYRMYLELRDTDYEKEDRRYYYPGTFERSAAGWISVGRAAAVEGLQWELPKGFLVRTVEGQVVAANGQPVGGAAVSLRCARSNDPQRGVLENQMLHEVQTDANGRFRLEAITGTVYWLAARLHAKAGSAAAYSPGMRLLATREVRNQELVLSETNEVNGCQRLAELETARSIRSQPLRPGEVNELIVQMRRQMDEAKLIDPPEFSARDSLARLRYIAPRNPEVANLARLLSDQLLEKGRAALRAVAYERSQQLLEAARQVGPGSDPAALSQAEAELRAARERSGM